MPNPTLKGSLEDNLLTLLISSDQHAPQLILELTPDLFSTRHYQDIAKVAFAYIEKYGRAPGAHARDLLEDQLRRGDAGSRLLALTLQEIDKLAPDIQPEYVLQSLSHFIRERKFYLRLDHAAALLRAGELDEAEEALHNGAVVGGVSPGIWLSDADRMLAFLDKPEDDFFSSGVDELDKRGVKPGRKQLFLIIGSKKAGKSWWLIQMGREATRYRKSVLHVTLELSEEYTAERYTQALFAMTTHEAQAIRVPIFKKNEIGQVTEIDFDTRTPAVINADTRGDVAERLRAFERKAPLLIKEFPTASLTVSRLTAYLDMLDRTHSFRPDLLIIDYAGIMAFDQRNMRVSMGATLQQLRGLAVARNMAVVTAWQGNRSTAAARTVTSGMVAEDWSAVGTADFVVTISKTASEAKVGLARLLVDAARTVRDKYLVMITQSYDTGQFCLDSTYMSRFLEDEVKRMNGDDDDGGGDDG